MLSNTINDRNVDLNVGRDFLPFAVHEPNARVSERCQGRLPLVIVVEARDQVFARLSSELIKIGKRVVRATSTDEALQLLTTLLDTEQYEVLVLASTQLPDSSGWLLAGKIQLMTCETEVWLYQDEFTHYHDGLGTYLGVSELIEYGGQVSKLAGVVVELLSRLRIANRSRLEQSAAFDSVA